ncbi:hypothetical protein J2X46_003816 [Nocardioides sp. BE266]|uniref:hypothetical protein n=1 Tax=Nocardioides sp. BE266 TaxID=2817725 RepID=UPI002857950A|nr:hypothetical protein [Nocardioides sp. BE266]MDR7254818.1 hypothetical protein [Nocardioides sp. BE266]
MRALVLALALLVPALSACSGGESDATPATAEKAAQQEDEATAAWRAAVEDELGADTFDFDALRASAAVDCQRTDAGAWSAHLALSGDTATSALTRIGLEHACADVVPAFDQGVATVEKAADPLDLVCGPDAKLSSEDALTADLVCANR